MTIFYFSALVTIGLALSILMAFAWVVRERTGNSGWVVTVWTFAIGLVGAGSALWPVGGERPNARQWLVAALVTICSLRLWLHIAIRTAGISDGPRYAAFAKEWGANASRRMLVLLQNQALGSIPLVFAIFVAARFPSSELPWSLAPLLAPVFMYWILVYVTGILALEEQMLRSRGEGYRADQSRTSKFFLLPPYARSQIFQKNSCRPERKLLHDLHVCDHRSGRARAAA